MEYKTREMTKVGFVENGFLDPIGRCHRLDEDENPYDPNSGYSDPEGYVTPNGELIPGVWATGEYHWQDRISVTRTPPPHTTFTECHQQRTQVFDAHSWFERRSTMISWDGKSCKLTKFGNNAIQYRAALWNYVPGEVFDVDDATLRRVQESALLNFWAGRPRRHMNVALALIELRDVKKTFSQFLEFSQFGAKLIKGQLRLPPAIKSVVGARPGVSLSCQKIAEAYLWYTFGVRPTAEDLARFCREVSKEKLQVRGRKRKPLLKGRTYANGFQVESRRPEDLSSDWYYPDKREFHWPWRYISPYGSPVWSVTPPNPHFSMPSGFTTTKYTGKIFAKVRENGEWTWKHFPSSFNWSCPIGRTAWELVPFSFVLDWFVDVGKSISRLDDLSWVATTRFAFEDPWMWVRKEQTHWAPVYDYQAKLDVETSVEGEGSAAVCRARGSGEWTGWQHYRPERTIVTFDRAPCSAFGLTYASLWSSLVPEWQGKVKAYQISSGMALLESIAHLI